MTAELSAARLRLPRAFQALQHAPFRALWLSSMVTQAGFWLANVSLQLLVLRAGNGDPIKQALLGFANFIPILLLSPIAGVMADRWDRRAVAVASQLLLGGMALLLAAAAALGHTSLPELYVLAFGLGVALSTGSPAIQALTADSVPSVDLASAVSLQSMSINLSRIAGPAIAVPLVLWKGPAAAFVVFAATAVATGLLIARIRLPVTIAPAATGRLREELWHGIAHAAERRPALTILSMVAIAATFSSSLNQLLPVVAVDVLGLPDAAFFRLVVALGIGATAGAIAVGFIPGGIRLRWAAAQMIALGLLMAALGLAPPYATALVVIGMVGALNFGLLATLNIALQFAIAAESRGRVMALYVLAWGGLPPFGVLALGAVAAWIGTGRAVALFGLIVVLHGVLVGVRHRRRRYGDLS